MIFTFEVIEFEERELLEAEKMSSCQIRSKCDKSLSHKDLISHQKPDNIIFK